jgi:MFS family permease
VLTVSEPFLTLARAKRLIVLNLGKKFRQRFKANSTLIQDMKQETNPKRKMTILRAILFMVLVLIAAFILLIAFVGGIIGALATGNYSLFAGGIILFLFAMAIALVAKKFESDFRQFQKYTGVKKKTTRELIKENLPFIFLLLASVVLAFVFEEYFLSFPSNISSSLGKEILNSMLTLDGIMIGFCGVVVAQFLWAIHSKGNILFEQMIVKNQEARTLELIDGELETLRKIRLEAIVTVFYSLIPILASFLICLMRLPMTEGVNVISTKALLYDPITSLLIGVFLLVWATAKVNLLPKSSRDFEKEKKDDTTRPKD